MTEEKDECNGCKKEFLATQLEYGYKSRLFCASCHEPTCRNCGEFIGEEDGRYCSHQCYKEEMADLCED